MSVIEEEGIVIWKVVSSCVELNCVFETLNSTKFALPQSYQMLGVLWLPCVSCILPEAFGRLSINQSWGAYAGGRVASPTPRRHSRRSRIASLHAGSLPIRSDSQQEASTCCSHEFCARAPPSRDVPYGNNPISRIGLRVSRHMPL